MAHSRAAASQPGTGGSNRDHRQLAAPHYQATRLRKAGGTREVYWSSMLLENSAGEPIGTLSIGRDITHQLAAETARDRAIEELEELKQQLEEENIYLKEEAFSPHQFTDIVGRSNALMYVLGLNPSTLRFRMKKHRLKKPGAAPRAQTSRPPLLKRNDVEVEESGRFAEPLDTNFV